jgi:hypothetical protein
METSKNGVSLVDNGRFWSIVKYHVNPAPKAAACSVYHTGAENYIKAKWKKSFK